MLETIIQWIITFALLISCIGLAVAICSIAVAIVKDIFF